MKTILSLIAIAFLFQSCGDAEAEAKRKKELPTIKVTTAKATVSKLPKQYKFSAKIEADKQTQLSTRLMGEIIYMKVKEGQKVAKGQTIARIKNTDIQAKKSGLQANMSEAKAGLKSVTTDYTRMKALFEKKSATQKELDDITAHYEMAQAKVEALKHAASEIDEMLDYAEIKSPFAGVITKKFMNEGNIASPGMPLVAIQGTGVYKAVAKVSESEIGMLKTGAAVKVQIGAISEENLLGTVAQINPSGGYSGAQFEVTILLNPSRKIIKELKNGLYASVILENGFQKHILIPQEAIVRKGQLLGLFTVDNQQKAMLRWVRTGKTFDNKIEILSGLSEGENYILTHQGRLFNGSKIVIND